MNGICLSEGRVRPRPGQARPAAVMFSAAEDNVGLLGQGSACSRVRVLPSKKACLVG